MDTHSLINMILFVVLFLLISASLEIFARKSGFPFSIMILVAGLIVQGIIITLDIDMGFPLIPDIIYFFILPILLFESALHINFHQFRLQFKTISFIATFGLIVSVFLTGSLLFPFVDMTIQECLLYGAIISATDPIAVISIFKSLGSPKRLGLIAEGESMFNDATGVLIFKIIAGFTLANSSFKTDDLLSGISSFVFIFIVSILFGALIGYIGSLIIAQIEEDAIAETTITAIVAVLTFIAADHFLHLSGVISTVMAGIAMGNIGRTKFSPGVVKFIDQFWEYTGFFAVSFVFFVTGLNLNIVSMFDYIGPIAVAIGAMLVARAVSVYLSFFITNNVRVFNDEPNVPLSWQHVLNWGGLRGVIPLVLVYSLPDTFALKDEFLIFTLSSLLFTILINGSTIGFLIRILKLHIPQKEEWINKQEDKILRIENAMEELKSLNNEEEYDPLVLKDIIKKLKLQEDSYKEELNMNMDKMCSLKSCQIKSLEIEQLMLEELYSKRFINENVYFKFQSELHLQQDAIEYPEVYSGRAIKKGGFVDSEKLFDEGLSKFKTLIKKFGPLKPFILSRRKRLIEERLSLLHARLMTSREVMKYMTELKKVLKDNQMICDSVDQIIEKHNDLLDDNERQIQQISKKFPEILSNYQRTVLQSQFLNAKPVIHNH